MRKLAVHTSRDGFLEYMYQDERPQLTGAERSGNTHTARPERTGQASLAPGPGRQLKRPAWYTSIKPQEWQSRSRHAGYTGVDAKLSKIKRLIRDCAEKKLDAFDDIRKELHQLAFLEVNKIVVRKTQMLHEDTGLPQLFAAEYSKGVDYPWDIQADALELYNRWCLQIFSTDLLRGIVKSQKAHNRSTDRIEPGFPGKSGAAYYGQGDLVNGQWWPTQLCTVRDGAHGSTQGGIYSVKGKAAFSIIVSGGSQYNDRDEGHELRYSGTNSTDGKYTENTQSLILSVEDKKPVRVIRSHNIHKGASKYRPARGFRYDGLYDVVGYQVVDESKKACLFHMVRRPDQDPIRAEGKAMRPTEEEIAEYDKIKKELNSVGSEI
ncbi:PUA-like domain-containing protein [Phyllosticta citribraziliensis]